MKQPHAIRGLVVATAIASAAIIGVRGQGAIDFTSYVWTKVYDGGGAGWARRAGLQAVELPNRLYVMGGRTPFPTQFNPFGSVLWDDVWESRDLGATWQQVAAGPVADPADPSHIWSARGYFQAVTKGGAMFVLGGQDFSVAPNPLYPDNCPAPPGVPPPCPPFVPLPAALMALATAFTAAPAHADPCEDIAKQLAGQIDGLKVNFSAANITYLTLPAAKELSLGCRGKDYSIELFAKTYRKMKPEFFNLVGSATALVFTVPKDDATTGTSRCLKRMGILRGNNHDALSPPQSRVHAQQDRRLDHGPARQERVIGQASAATRPIASTILPQPGLTMSKA